LSVHKLRSLLDVNSLVDAIVKIYPNPVSSITKAATNTFNVKLRQPPPRHIAFIMDGNRRYGVKRYGAKLQGHEAGGRKLTQVLQWCLDLRIQEVTCFAFSTENWNRDPREVNMLMASFLRQSEEIEKQAMIKHIRVQCIISEPESLPVAVFDALTRLQNRTMEFSRLTLNICISYGARSELIQAVKSLLLDITAGQLSPQDITEHHLESRLLLRSPPDLLLRTSGEQRLSNFLLWQIAYTELVFLDKLWPELIQSDFSNILNNYSSRHRRYGQ